jgi:hypothetical protein
LSRSPLLTEIMCRTLSVDPAIVRPRSPSAVSPEPRLTGEGTSP